MVTNMIHPLTFVSLLLRERLEAQWESVNLLPIKLMTTCVCPDTGQTFWCGLLCVRHEVKAFSP